MVVVKRNSCLLYFFIMIKNIYYKLVVKNIFNIENLEVFFLKLRIRKLCLILLLYFSIFLKVG